MTEEPVDRPGEHMLRELAPQVLAAVARRYGDFAAAEDAVQEALLAAVSRWPSEGVPDDPRAWLIQVAARRMADHLRAEIARRRRESAAAAPAATSRPDTEEAGQDDELQLLFMCCHPALTHSSAICLSLRAVGGLTTAEIASAFLVPEATMAQRISRAKQTIEKAGARFKIPEHGERAERLAAVLHVLYLIFNEGYTSSGGPTLQRVDLASEAIRLARAVHHAVPADGEVAGLLALMLLTDARRAARTGPHGELIPLDEQDRSRWDRDAMAEGTALLGRALATGRVGAYQLQAAIAAAHAQAARPQDTDWRRILVLYELLQRMVDNPMVALNRAVAAAMVHGPAAGLELLNALDDDPRIARHHRLAAVRAHLHEKAGHIAAAIAHYRAAAEATSSAPERDYLSMKAARLQAP